MAEASAATAESGLDALSRAYGIAAEYKDIWGKPQRASDKTRLALLRALGALDDERSDVDAAVHSTETQKWRSVLPRVAVFRVDALPYRMHLHFKAREEH